MALQVARMDVDPSNNNKLPIETLAHVLRLLPLRQRLESCMIVCKSWEAAAGAATNAIIDPVSADLPRWLVDQYNVLPTPQQRQSMQAWLRKHGSNLVQLNLRTPSEYIYLYRVPNPLEFAFPGLSPLTQLQTLTLKGFKLLGSSSNSSSGGDGSEPAAAATAGGLVPWAWTALTALTTLHLDNCSLYGSMGPGLQQLSALKNLKQLNLDRCTMYPAGTAAAAAMEHIATFGCSLAQLVQLTSISLSGLTLNSSAFSGLSCLQQLLELKIDCDPAEPEDATAADVSLDVLPQGLKVLHCVGKWRFTTRSSSSSTAAAAMQLTAMQKLHLEGADVFEPAILNHMPQLQHMCIGATSLPSVSAAGVAALLAVLPQLQQLQELELFQVMRPELAGYQIEQYTALVASSNLTRLALEGCEVAPGALLQAFAAGDQLPALKELQLGPHKDNLVEVILMKEPDAACRPIAYRDLGRLALCCPALQDLSVIMVEPTAAAAAAAAAGVPQEAEDEAEEDAAAVADAASFLQLTALTRLVIGGGGVDDAFAGQVLAQLTALQDLSILTAKNLTVDGLESLTQLTSLQQLWVHEYGTLSPWNRQEHSFRLESVAHLYNKDAPPNVWSKLRNECTRLRGP